MKKHTLRVTHSTKERLQKLKISKKESYDDVLTRILDAKLGNMKITYTIHDKYNIIYATIDYDQPSQNIVFEHEGKLYDNVMDLPTTIRFKKSLSRLDLFEILPVLNSNQSVVVDDIVFVNVTDDMR